MELHATALRGLAGQVAAGGGSAWVIGGTLRDLLLGRTIHDIDIALTLPALEAARALADDLSGSYVPLDEGHAVARVVLRDGTVLDLASLRAPTLEGDLRARDFTANAMAAPLLPDGAIGPLIDPLGGQADSVCAASGPSPTIRCACCGRPGWRRAWSGLSTRRSTRRCAPAPT
jgi:tRNA nucleotidyltransferase/poly(A) polymerase